MSAQESQESQLAQLKAKALKAYAQKDYATSTELYASACELQSTLHGENNPKNAHLLYLYGRSLFEVALKKSDVLGGVTQEDKPEKEKKEKKTKDKPSEAPATNSEVAIADKAEKSIPKAKAGLFQFTGDENWDDTDEEDEDEADEADEEGKAADEEDDFTLAWEILDYARVLFLKQLSPDSTAEANPADSTTTDTSTEPVTSIPNEDAAAPPDDETKALKTALADTYDLLGEVSLESESFAQAAKDLRSSLELKLELYPTESTLISEAHYKLSLALEFTAAGEDVSASDRKKGREEAAEQMEMAIASCRARIKKEEAEIEVAEEGKGKGKETVTKSLKDAREMVEELETRLVDLRTTDSVPLEVADPLQGILGQVLGEDQATARKRIEEAMSGARDLTGLVRKKAPAAAPVPTPVTTTVVVPEYNGNGKRKLDDLAEKEEEKEGSKKAKVEEKVEEKFEEKTKEKVEEKTE